MGTVHAKEGAFRDFDDDDVRPKIQKIMLEKAKATVDKIHINGLNRTKDDVIEASVNDLFAASNYKDVMIKADKVRMRMEALGCFSSVTIFVDVSKGPNASPDGLEVTFHVNELKRFLAGVNTTVGDNTGSLVIGAKAPNLGGRGERVQCEYSRSYNKFSNYALSFIKPYPYKKYEPIITASVVQQLGEFPQSGYRQLDKGILLDLGFRTSPRAQHNIQWDGIFRDTSPLSRVTSFAVREDSGPRMKSAIRYILSIDNRDEKILPTHGNFLQITSELSGLGGNMSFLKNDLYFQANYPLLIEGMTFQTTGQLGLLNNFHGTNITENFFIGGPSSIRGFDVRGIGPQSEGSALGSNFYWTSGLHLYTPLPFRPGKGGIGDGFRTHFFLTAGNLGPIKTLQDIEASITTNVRMSFGLGIALKVGQIVRFELNYCFPKFYIPGDQISPGVQFGLGINFV